MTCKQLGGACELAFHAETFDELAEKSKRHGMEMFQKQDQEHLEAMDKMQTVISDPKALQEWMEAKRKEFEALPESE